MKVIILSVFLIVISTLSGQINAATADTGNIKRLFVDSGSAPDILKSTLLAAKAAGQSITVVICGCLRGWYKINQVYVN